MKKHGRREDFYHEKIEKNEREDNTSRFFVRFAFFAVNSLLLAMGLLLAQCGSPHEKSGGGKKDAVHVEVWQGFNPEETVVFREIMADFERKWEEQNGRPLKINLQYVSFNDMFTKLRTAAMARATPDVAFVDSIKVTDLAFGRALARIDQLPVFKKRYGNLESARPQFVRASFEAAVVNRLGEVGLYGLPVQTTCVALFWNREMFRAKSAELRAAGLDPNRPPRDWDEMNAYGKILTDRERGIYAFGLYNSLWFNFPYFNMYGVEFIRYGPDGKAEAALDTPRGRAALARILAIANSGVEGGAWKRSALGPDAGFMNRKYAMIFTGPWNVENFTNGGLDFDIALIPAPPRAEVDALGLKPADPTLETDASAGGAAALGPLLYTSSNVGGQTGVVLRASHEQEIAFEILDYFTSEAVQRRWGSQLGQIPVRMAAWKDLDTSKYPYLPKFMLQLRTARRVPQIPLYGALESDVFNPQIDLLLQNRQTPEEMLQKMERTLKGNILDKINESASSAADVSSASSAPSGSGGETVK